MIMAQLRDERMGGTIPEEYLIQKCVQFWPSAGDGRSLPCPPSDVYLLWIILGLGFRSLRKKILHWMETHSILPPDSAKVRGGPKIVSLMISDLDDVMEALLSKVEVVVIGFWIIDREKQINDGQFRQSYTCVEKTWSGIDNGTKSASWIRVFQHCRCNIKGKSFFRVVRLPILYNFWR